MLLVSDDHRLDSRSTAEMTIEEMTRLKTSLESSEVIRQYEYDRRPRRGGVMYRVVQLLLLYLFMECRRMTYRGIVRNLSDHDCECIGFPRKKDGTYRRPSSATLNNFVNHVLSDIAENIGDELSKAVLNVLDDPIVTIDSTPLQASRYNSDAEFNPHYDIRMDKAHMIMAGGFPIRMMLSRGCANDSPFGIPLTDDLCTIRPGIKINEFHTDGVYDVFGIYAHIWFRTGAVMRCNQGTDGVYSGIDGDKIRDEYNGMWKKNGYDPRKKNDVDLMLRFLYRHGKDELVGRYIRDRSMDIDAKEGRTDARHVCETVHRAMKRWMAFDIFRISKATKTIRMRCRFLCVQMLAVLFKGYTET